MHLVRFTRRCSAEAEAEAGALGDDGVVTPLGATLAELLRCDLGTLRASWDLAVAGPASCERLALAACSLHPPVEARMEVWAAGVTYERSRDERMKESAAAASVYDDVYDAERPELFFKSVPWRVVADDEPIGVRSDSEVDVPEPELALLVNAGGEIVGYTICDDVSSRSIEGGNPLYLPQAKIYTGSCSLAARVRPSWEIADPYALELSVAIERAGSVVYAAAGSTCQLHRRLDDLVDWLRREMDFPDGVVLSTGTSLVPQLPFTLEHGDEVRVTLSGVGTLTNRVVAARALRPAG